MKMLAMPQNTVNFFSCKGKAAIKWVLMYDQSIEFCEITLEINEKRA